MEMETGWRTDGGASDQSPCVQLLYEYSSPTRPNMSPIGKYINSGFCVTFKLHTKANFIVITRSPFFPIFCYCSTPYLSCSSLTSCATRVHFGDTSNLTHLLPYHARNKAGTETGTHEEGNVSQSEDSGFIPRAAASLSGRHSQ
jgi:hypothetical protein